MQDGEGEGCGFTGSGLSAAEEIPAIKEKRDCLGLDGGGGCVIEFGKNLFEGGGQFHGLKRRGHNLMMSCLLSKDLAGRGSR